MSHFLDAGPTKPKGGGGEGGGAGSRTLNVNITRYGNVTAPSDPHHSHSLLSLPITTLCALVLAPFAVPKVNK